MKYLKGIIEFDNIKTSVEVFLTVSTSFRLGNWNGVGYSTECVKVGEYDSNIGKIIVNNVNFNNDKFIFEFIGSGEFKGFDKNMAF